MVYDVLTTLDGAEVLRRAKAFFAERVPMQAAFPEKEGPAFVTLRGQGGEEVAIAVMKRPQRHACPRRRRCSSTSRSTDSSRRFPRHRRRRRERACRVRVMVQDAWDEVTFDLPPTTSLADVKRRALAGGAGPRRSERLSPQVPWRRAARRNPVAGGSRPGPQRGPHRASPSAPAGSLGGRGAAAAVHPPRLSPARPRPRSSRDARAARRDLRRVRSSGVAEVREARRGRRRAAARRAPARVSPAASRR